MQIPRKGFRVECYSGCICSVPGGFCNANSSIKKLVVELKARLFHFSKGKHFIVSQNLIWGGQVLLWFSIFVSSSGMKFPQ